MSVVERVSTVKDEVVGCQPERKRLKGCRNAPARLKVVHKRLGNEARLLLDLVDDVGLVHHIPLSKANERLEVVGKKLAADVDSAGKATVKVGPVGLDDEGRTFGRHSAPTDPS